MPTPNYDLIAVDLDGTLFDPEGEVSAANRAAVQAARAAGIEVIICTGRGLAESAPVLQPLGFTGTAVVAGGALTADLDTGRTLNRQPMPPALVQRITGFLLERTEHPVLALKDRGATGIDYLVIGDRRLDPSTEWWFNHMPVAVDRVVDITLDPHPADTVRLGVVTYAGEMKALGQAVVRAFGSEAFVHHFPVITKSVEADPRSKIEEIHLLEIFDIAVNKWTAIDRYIRAHPRGPIDPRRVATIGDQINDVAMIRHAGLGIAMGNAIPELKRIAGRITRPNTEDGVAYAIEQILGGAW